MKKRLISLALVLLTIFACIPNWNILASAKTETLNNLSASQTISSKIYGTLREGNYSAYKDSNGVWWYKFTRDNHTVKIKASAFTSKVGNNLSKVNEALTKGITRKDTVSTSYAYAYRTRTSSYNKSTKTNSYETNIAWLNFSSLRDGKNIDLESNRCSNVCFYFNDKVPVYYKRITKNGKTTRVKCKAGEIGSTMVMEKPSTAGEYKQALKRSTDYTKKITPVFTLEVTKPGTNLCYLSTAKFAGRGVNGSTKTNLSEYIDIAYTVGNIGANMATKGLTVGSLYSVIKVIYNLEEKKKEKNKSVNYTCDDKIKLSNDNARLGKKVRTLKADFESPIKLKNYNDYFRVEVQLTNTPSYNKTKTQLKASVKTIIVK